MAERSEQSRPIKDEATKRTRRLRPFPAYSLQDALLIAQSIADNNAGRPYSRFSLAESIGRSPESSEFRSLISSSSAYGLTEGSYQALQVNLTPAGTAIVLPRSEDERQRALVDVAMNVDLFQRLYKHFDQHRLSPQENFRHTLLRDYNLDASLIDECIAHFRADGQFVGLIRSVAGAERISIHDATGSLSGEQAVGLIHESAAEQPDTGVSAPELKLVPAAPAAGGTPQGTPQNQRVFITHGRNHSIVQQLKELLTFGKLVPVVAQENETVSKPVPDKVMEAMRSCAAGIIHVASEDVLLDSAGQQQHKINENVLIEIGASMALYRDNFILLVQKGIHLPSNLQGLYRCEYEGDKLDYEATMKLLKTFNEFK